MEVKSAIQNIWLWDRLVMLKIILAASSGIFIFVSGLAWGVATFKDGVISSDKVIEKKGCL